jgi:hypothetical protein
MGFSLKFIKDYWICFFGEKNESYKLRFFFQKMLVSQKRIVPKKKCNKLTSLLYCLALWTLALDGVLTPCRIDVASCTKQNLAFNTF